MSYAEEVRRSAMEIAGRYETLMREYGELLAENRELKAKLVQQEQAGWISVPVSATPEMVEAAEEVEDLYKRGTPEAWKKVYRAMLAAAPKGEKP